VLCQDCSWITGWVEKRSQIIENTLEPESFFMKLRAPQALGRQTGSNPEERLTPHTRAKCLNPFELANPGSE